MEMFVLQQFSSNMDKIKKIHFKAAVITSQELIHRIDKYINALENTLFIHRNNFKYFLHFAQRLPENFTKSAILYSISKRFASLTDTEKIDLIVLSRQLQQTYTALNMRVLKKKDAFFYFLCIYLTKLTSNFLQDTFVDILVQPHLESEVYISLVYVMIGIQVSPKSYEVNHRKVISEPLNFRTKTYLVTKTEPIESVVPKLSNKKINLLSIPSKRIQAKFTLERKPTHVFKTDNPSDSQLFKSSLKQNLMVEVLPKIPPKKLRAAQFDKIAEASQVETTQSQQKNKVSRVENEIIKPSNNFLQSTQNSTSYEMFFKINHQNIMKMHKTVKISYRPQLVQNSAVKTQKLLDTSVPMEEANNNEKKSESQSNRKNWQQIVRNIKQNTVYTTKHNFQSLWMDNNNDNQEITLTAEQRGNQNFALNLQRARKQAEQKTQQARISTKGLLVKPRHINTQFIEDKQKYLESRCLEVEKEKSQNYRAERRLFDAQCKNRQMQTAYSMFNTANINTSLVKFGLTHK